VPAPRLALDARDGVMSNVVVDFAVELLHVGL